MISLKYQKQLKEMTRRHFSAESYKSFIFGSSLTDNNFQDVDIALLGTVSVDKIEGLKSEIEESTFPYFVDIVAMDLVGEDFSNSVLKHQNKLWI